MIEQIPDFEETWFNVAGGMKKRLAGCICRVAASFFLVRRTADCYFFHQGKK